MLYSRSSPLLVFDLDGTLVDSHKDLVPALNHATSTVGLQPIADSDVGHVVGQGVRKMIELAFVFHGQSVDAATVDALMPVFLARYETHIADQTRPFPGARAALERFQENGWHMAVCTNKLQHLAVKLMNEVGLNDLVPIVTGGDTFAVRKPDPGHLLQTIDRAGGDWRNTIMVGDSVSDIAAAQAARVPVIAVSFGYSDRPAAELGADCVISHFDHLWDAVAGLKLAA